MKTYIFSNKLRPLGWFLFISCFILGFIHMVYDFELFEINSSVFSILSTPLFEELQSMSIIENNVADELLSVGLIIGLLLLAFSKEKIEDEYTIKMRLDAFIWAVFVNQLLILFSVLFFYDFIFLNIMVFNLFSTLILFVMRYEYMKHVNNKSFTYDQ